jgi:hypothetical protein
MLALCPAPHHVRNGMASATLVIYSLPKLGISKDFSARGRFVGLPSVPRDSPAIADALRSYCCLLLPRGFSKSFVKNEKTGRGGGDRTKSGVETA